MKKFRNKSYIDLISFSVELKVTDVTEITIKDNEFIMHNIEEIILSEDKTILMARNKSLFFINYVEFISRKLNENKRKNLKNKLFV